MQNSRNSPEIAYLHVLCNNDYLENKKIECRRAINLKKTVDSLTTNDKLSPNAFWKMRKSVNKNPGLKLREVGIQKNW